MGPASGSSHDKRWPGALKRTGNVYILETLSGAQQLLSGTIEFRTNDIAKRRYCLINDFSRYCVHRTVVPTFLNRQFSFIGPTVFIYI